MTEKRIAQARSVRADIDAELAPARADRVSALKRDLIYAHEGAFRAWRLDLTRERVAG